MKNKWVGALIAFNIVLLVVIFCFHAQINFLKSDKMYFRGYAHRSLRPSTVIPVVSQYVPLFSPNLEVFREKNKKLPPPGAGQRRIVFLGDSITEGWPLVDVFEKNSIQVINRGIGGEQTGEMLTRFNQDVVDLHPAVVHILGGSNEAYHLDMSSHAVCENLRLLSEFARLKGIRVFLGTIPTAGDNLDDSRRAPLESRNNYRNDINKWIQNFCNGRTCTLVDYSTALSDANGNMVDPYFKDFIHPSEKGYAVMTEILKKSLLKESANYRSSK
jgi:lysophospholipase L1-like esterase